jgi:ATP-dependent RNA helicase RhlE
LDIYEKYEIKDIEKLIGLKIQKDVVEGFEPDPNIRRKDVEERKLKNEHKKEPKKRVRQYNKNTSNFTKSKKKRKTTKRD